MISFTKTSYRKNKIILRAITYMGINSIDKTLAFIDNIINTIYQSEVDSFDSIDDLSKGIKEIINKSKQPYHINILDLLWANENAHSRILSELMKQNNGGVYEILESFILCFFKENINVLKPLITSETHRIDLLIQEAGKYAIIFENKIHNAILQKNQLARYIEKVKQLGYKEEQIYVVYLPPDDYNQPNQCCWNIPAEWCDKCNVNEPSLRCDECESHKNRFTDRFKSLSYRRDILPWLKDEILHNCRMKDVYLYTSVFQYIDHLEGLFDIRIINNNLNMEIKEHISKALELSDSPEKNHASVEQKYRDVSKVLNQLSSLKDDIEKECWGIWLNRLKQKYPNYDIIDYRTERKFTRVGVSMIYKGVEFAILIEKEDRIYYGVSRPNLNVKIDESIKPFLTKAISEIGGFGDTSNWYGWQYTSFQNGFERLITLITLVEDKIKADSL